MQPRMFLRSRFAAFRLFSRSRLPLSLTEAIAVIFSVKIHAKRSTIPIVDSPAIAPHSPDCPPVDFSLETLRSLRRFPLGIDRCLPLRSLVNRTTGESTMAKLRRSISGMAIDKRQ